MAFGEAQYIESLKCMSNQSLAEAYGVIPAKYDDVTIKEGGFSNRAYHCLMRKGIRTFGDLLRFTGGEIYSIQNLGKTSAQEICERCQVLFRDELRVSSKIVKTYTGVGKVLTYLLEEISKEISERKLSDSEMRDLAVDICSYLHIPNDEKVILQNRIDQEYEDNLPDQVYGQSVDSILEKIGRKAVLLCFKLFLQNKGITFSCTVDEESICLDIKNKLSNTTNVKERALIKEFICWISVDLSVQINSAIDSELDSRTREILMGRIGGNTLEKLGQDWGLTRERIRQLEIKALRKLRHALVKSGNLLLLIGISGAEGTISKNRLNEFLTAENVEIVWRFLKENDLPNVCFYSAEMDLVFVGESKRQNSKILSDKVSQFPSVIANSEIDQYQLDLINEGFDSTLVIREFKTQYVQYPGVFSREKFSLSDMCGYILEHDFELGLDLSNSEMIEIFHRRMKELFGNEEEISDKYLYNLIYSCSFQVDTNTYKHIKYMLNYVEAVTIATDFFASSGRNVMSYRELYSHIKDLISALGVSNECFLHGLLSKSGTQYKTTRDYIKKNESDSFDDEFVSIIKTIYPISVSKVCDMFCISDAQCRQVASRCGNIKICGPMILYKP